MGESNPANATPFRPHNYSPLGFSPKPRRTTGFTKLHTAMSRHLFAGSTLNRSCGLRTAVDGREERRETYLAVMGSINLSTR